MLPAKSAKQSYSKAEFSSANLAVLAAQHWPRAILAWQLRSRSSWTVWRMSASTLITTWPSPSLYSSPFTESYSPTLLLYSNPSDKSNLWQTYGVFDWAESVDRLQRTEKIENRMTEYSTIRPKINKTIWSNWGMGVNIRYIKVIRFSSISYFCKYSHCYYSMKYYK